MRVVIHDELKEVVQAGVFRLSDLTLPDDNGDALWRVLTAETGKLRRRYGDRTVGQVPGVREARDLYRRVGIDPTKTRPSSEALLRRVIKGKELYRIHPLVDLLNLVSVTELIPVGLYDMLKIVGDKVTLRLGGEGEGFDGIRKARVNVAGRLCVTDGEGPFGSPTSDSLRTSIEGEVPAVLGIFFQPKGGDEGRLERALDRTAQLAGEYFGAVVAEKYLLNIEGTRKGHPNTTF